MDLGLRNNVAWVAGSSRGLGKTIALTFMREGARVIFTGRHRQSLTALEKELRQDYSTDSFLTVRADLAKGAQVQRCIRTILRRFGRIDIVVCNVGQSRGQKGWNAPHAQWAELLDANLSQNVGLARRLLPVMIRQKAGSIVFIASITGHELVGGPLAYGSAKAGLLHFAKALADEAAPYHIRVNCVSPGNLLYPGSPWEGKLHTDRTRVLSYIRRAVPLARFGTAEEIAATVAFVASPRASFMTGSTIVVDGGQRRGCAV